MKMSKKDKTELEKLFDGAAGRKQVLNRVNREGRNAMQRLRWLNEIKEALFEHRNFEEIVEDIGHYPSRKER